MSFYFLVASEDGLVLIVTNVKLIRCVNMELAKVLENVVVKMGGWVKTVIVQNVKKVKWFIKKTLKSA